MKSVSARFLRRANLPIRIYFWILSLYCAPLAVVLSSVPSAHSAEISAEEKAQLEALTFASWEKAQALVSEGKYAEAYAIFETLSQLITPKLGAQDPMCVQNDALKSTAKKMMDLSASAHPEKDPKKTYVDSADLERSQAAQKEAKDGLALLKTEKKQEGLLKIDNALDTLEFTLGPDDKFVVALRNLILQFYQEVYPNPTKVEAISAREKKARAQRQQKDAHDTELDQVREIIMRAMVAFTAQDFETSLRLFESVMPRMDAALSETPETIITARTILARIYDYSLRYDDAEALLVRVISDTQSKYGADSALLENPLEGATMHFLLRGVPKEAYPYADHWVKIVEKHKKDSRQHAAALLQRGDILLFLQRFEESSRDYLAVQQMLKRQSDPDPVQIVMALQSLRSIYSLMGDHKSALALLIKSCELGSVSDSVRVRSMTESDCVKASALQQDWGTVKSHLERQLRAISAAEGEFRSSKWSHTAEELARTEFALNNKEAATTWMRQVLDFEDKRMERELLSGSDSQKLEKFSEYQNGMYTVLDLGGAAPGSGPMQELALQTLLRRKGKVLDAETAQLRAARQITDPEAKKLFQRQQEVRALLTGLTLKGQTAPGGELEFKEALLQLEQEDGQLTRQLALKSAPYRQLSREVTVDAVRGALDNDTVLLEYAFHVRHDLTTGSPTSIEVIAFLLSKQQPTFVVPLGDALPILRGIEALRASVSSKQDISASATALHALIFAEVEKKLPSGTKRIVISPDDALNLVPFAALRGENKQYLLQKYEIDYVTTGRELLSFSSSEKARSSAVLFGAPDFDATASGPSGPVSGDLAQVHFPPLPGTREEVTLLAKQLPTARLWSGTDVTKEHLRALHGPAVLHIATHGFFLDIQGPAAEKTRGFDITPEIVPQGAPKSRTENPLLRSGLALSGANQKGNTAGVLAALEAGTLDLDGTQLVVLSACETAVGKTDPGRGVYGLRRSFAVAGAQAQLMSLWKVDDAATRDLMVHVYKELLSGKGRGAALRNAQLSLLKDAKTAHPYYWAAFIPSGNYTEMSFEVQKPVSSETSVHKEPASAKTSKPPQPWVMTASGSRMYLGLVGERLTNLLDQEDRMGAAATFQVELALIGDTDPDRRTGFAYHDSIVLGLSAGARVSKAHNYQNGEKESPFSWGYLAAYELGLGYRAGPIGVLAGLRPSYRGMRLGDARQRGFSLPPFAMLELRAGDALITAKGWYGTLLFDQVIFGGNLELGWEESVLIRLGFDQTKYSTKVGQSDSSDKVSADRQVNTALSLSFGGYLQ